MAGVKGRSGRKPTPTAQLKLRGSYRRDRHGSRDSEPTPTARLPDRPKWLTGEARREWERLGPLLAEQGLLTEWDRSLFSLYCQEWKTYVGVCRKLKTLDDCTVVTTKGNLIQHPLVGIKNRAYQNLLRIAAEFGLSPSSRARLHVQPAEEADPLTELLNRRKQRFFSPHFSSS